jgi:N-acetylneuraminate synthase/N,N'-diacetyllegionaminate synthase
VTLTVIAEAGVNHNGDETLAHALIDVAVEAGADAVKFQTFDTARLTSAHARTAPYQAERSDVFDQASLLTSLTLPESAWTGLRDHAVEAGITFLSTPFDLESARMLVDLGVSTLKVSSGELTNLPFLRALAAMDIPLLVSTGMGDAAEVAAAVEACAMAPSLTLFHCVSSYPAPIEQANLRAIPAMREAYGVPVGWSDHTIGTTSAIAAVALGASVLEKHVTTDKSLPGPDHAASAEPAELADYIAVARAAASALGDGVKRRMPAEQEVAAVARRSWHAVRELAVGNLIAEDDVVALRPELGISPAIDLTGARVTRGVAAGDPITADDVELP